MSRYTISNPVEDIVVVGWDNPLNTYFLQIFDYESDDDNLIFSFGQAFSECENIEDFQKRLLVFGISLSPEIIDHLQKDKENSAPRTSLQNKMNEIFKTLDKK